MFIVAQYLPWCRYLSAQVGVQTTFRGWSSTLAARVRLVISRLVLIFALPLDFHGRVRVVRSMYLHAALLRSSFRRVVWSRRQPLANIGAALNLLDGPTGCDPLFCVVWFRFRLLRRYLALWPAEVTRVYRLLEMVGESGPGQGPIHLLSTCAAEIGCRWNPVALAWVRPGLPMLSNLAGRIQHFRAAVLDAWSNKVAADHCGRKGVRGGPLLDVHGSLQLNSSHVRGLCFVALWLVVSGMLSCWVGLGVSMFPVGFVVLRMGMVIFFGDCTFPPLVEIHENPEFHDLMRMDKGHWPRGLLWHGWLPMLSGINGATPLGR